MRAGASGEAHGSERCRLASRQRDEHAEAEVRNRAGDCPAATAKYRCPAALRVCCVRSLGHPLGLQGSRRQVNCDVAGALLSRRRRLPSEAITNKPWAELAANARSLSVG